MDYKHGQNLGWGKVIEEGLEIWDARPIITGETVIFKDWIKMLFYPKKFLLYNFLCKNLKTKNSFKILDVGCSTGSAIIELKKIFGNRSEIYGVDVISLEIDIAHKRFEEYGVNANVILYDGKNLPFSSGYFDAVITSDVLGHVKDVPFWINEISRVLKDGGLLAMFSESKLGKHALIRNYLLKRGLNTDPHAKFHISLYDKNELKLFLVDSGFEIKKMYSTFLAKFLVHPDELYSALQNQKRFFILRNLNKFLYFLKQKTQPYSLAFAELYGLIEMLTIGRWMESQGYIVLAKKSNKKTRNN